MLFRRFSVVLPLRLCVSVAPGPAGRSPTYVAHLQRDFIILRTFLVALPPVLSPHPRYEHYHDQRDADCTDTPCYCAARTFSAVAVTLMYSCLAFDVV